ncbi:MAG TPA: hypothetical protein VFU05_07010, partial [Cyclobacteriaceae bacterium]|nr:hypothetical protein [Cyclobacteriaceae bacterium]
FSWPLVLACTLLIVLNNDSRQRWLWARFGLILSGAYLIYAGSNKLAVEHDLKEAQSSLGIRVTRSFTTPTPFNNWLWYAASETDSGFYVSYHSVFDNYPDTAFTFFEQNSELLGSLRDKKETEQLLQFSQGYYTVELWGDTAVFNILRFGQINGWHNRKAPFAFHYFLQHPRENTFVVQRGRFSGWNRETLQAFTRRIRGN